MSIDTPPAVNTRVQVRLADENDDASIHRYEVQAAHRALALLKSRLGRERLLDLLADDIAAGTAYLREHVTASAGQETLGATTLRAQGITAAAFGAWLSRAFAREDVLLAGHPEHYSIHAADGRVKSSEPLGEHVCSLFMREWDDAATPGVEPPPVDDDAVARRRSRMVLADGTPIGSIVNALYDEPDGFTVALSVTLPATCGPDIVGHHLEHFAIEFHNWILRAAAEEFGRG